MPTVDKGCTTHHHACDCREAKLAEVFRLLKLADDYSRMESQRVQAIRKAIGTMEGMGYGK